MTRKDRRYSWVGRAVVSFLVAAVITPMVFSPCQGTSVIPGMFFWMLLLQDGAWDWDAFYFVMKPTIVMGAVIFGLWQSWRWSLGRGMALEKAMADSPSEFVNESTESKIAEEGG